MYYRVDVRDLFSDTDPLSPRFVLTLVLNLPGDGAFQASRSGGREHRGWDVAQYTRAALVNELRAANHLTLLVNRDPKKSRPAPPVPFPTPGSNETKPPGPGSFAAIAASMIAAQRKKKKEAAGGGNRH